MAEHIENSNTRKRVCEISEYDGPSRPCHRRKRHCNIGLCNNQVDSSEKNHLFAEVPERILKNVTRALERLLVDNLGRRIVRLAPLKLLNCNAADSSLFSDAYCSMEAFDGEFSLWSLFQKGIQLLMDFIDADPEQESRVTILPDTKQGELILDKLLHYLVEIDQQFHGEIGTPDRIHGADLTIILANHLFGKVATSSKFLLNKQTKGNKKGNYKLSSCRCGTSNCKLTGRFGDTSIGNDQVWHGDLDAIIDDQVVLETHEGDTNSGYCLGDRSPADMERDHSVERVSRKQEIIAKTITFSFLQKQRHPDYEHFLFPCISVGNDYMVVYFYDSEHDILLESSRIPLLGEEGQTNLLAVIISWLVVNYKYTCDGLTEEMKDKQAGFISLAKSKLDVYERDLQFGDVENDVPSDVQASQPQLVEESVPTLRQKLDKDRLKTLLKFSD
ncbi:uncharacterized protein [Argopecten irradians]|uniref:uncharacterized protein n=1 Tax=Argopecten irradians TaxID=31199 RepID=UPI00372120F9